MPGHVQGLSQRRRVRVAGTVQGVGFRPFVYRLAGELGLAGYVMNDSAGVLIEVEGDARSIDELCRALRDDPPPLARVTSVESSTVLLLENGKGFRILESAADGAPSAPVSIDTSTCVKCLEEIDRPDDRRYRYPFTNCTNCGPRYTIVTSVPYDRPATTMAGFTMCAACQAEYDDPGDRRFHAQPNACADCGPTVSLHGPTGTLEAAGNEALSRVVDALRRGEILALKGVGGYHLAVDATNAHSVDELRRRKARDDKPFALMVRDLATARSLCDLPPEAEIALTSHRRPIVLAARRPGGEVAPGVAPGLPELGLMLPYAPLHHLLLHGVDRPLVMSSGNLADDPIAHTDEDALARLGPLVDGVLAHDRPIHIRCDDSVVRSTGRRIQMVRRSRGYAPESIPLAAGAQRQVLAVGGELKNTVSVAKQSVLVTSHHIGDLEHLATYLAFRQATGHLCRLFGVEPEVVAHDLHPDYLSTKYALELDLEPWPVQHHHAHVASCLAEHGRTESVLGIAFDGLGYGPDGTLWGGEFLAADLKGFERVAHLRTVGMPGGKAAIREPWRMALAWTAAACGETRAAALGRGLDVRWRAVLALAGDGRTPLTSSVGRLFDAAAVLCGVRSRVTYEGQAAIELEALARPVPASATPRYPLEIAGPASTPVLDPAPLIVAMLADLDRGTDPAVVAAGFQASLATATAALAARLAVARGLDTVALTGGVFQNVRLSDLVEDALVSQGLRVLVHHAVPCNDGGISVGQAAIASFAPRAGPAGLLPVASPK